MVSWRPEVLDLRDPAQAARAEALRQRADVEVFDTLQEQLVDLVKTRSPGKAWSAQDLQAAVAAEMGGDPARYGTWVFFAWSRRLVRLLPEGGFFELRTDRNRLKILRAQQEALRAKTIAIIGLSVGQSAAIALALEGIGGRFRLADFDTLALSNLNRLRAGIHELGVNKAVITARAMYELNPFLHIDIFEQGVTEANLDPFLAEADLLVEECDDLVIKVVAREAARARRIPVIMDTSERGMLDIERFDLEPERPVFHGLLPGVSAQGLRGLTAKEKLPLVLGIVGIDNIGREVAASMCEIDESISTWPQLGSSVTLGGALVADSARRILLDQLRTSGRYFVDLGQLIAPGTEIPLRRVDVSVVTLPEARAAREVARPAPRQDGALAEEELRFLIGNAILAPSGGNIQPWRFAWNGQILSCSLDPARSKTYLDYRDLASALSLGAAIENLALAASTLGLVATATATASDAAMQADGAPVIDVAFARADVPPSPLAQAIASRHTNRRLAAPSPLADAHLEAMRDAANDPQGIFAIHTDRAVLGTLGGWLGDVDRLRFLDPRMHDELIAELRWSPEEVMRTLDGIDLATLEMTSADAAIMRILAKPDAMQLLADIDGGGAMRRNAVKAMAQSSAAMLVGVRGEGPLAAVRAGRQVERVWLAATQCGLAVQPWSVITFLLNRHEAGASTTPRESALFARIGPAFRTLWGLGDGPYCAMLLRVSHAPPASAVSLRKDVARFLQK